MGMSFFIIDYLSSFEGGTPPFVFTIVSRCGIAIQVQKIAPRLTD